MLALIDGDTIVYRCGFAAEHNKYKVFLKGSEKEFGSVATFDTMKEVRTFVEDNTDYYWVKEIHPEPLSFCLHSVKVQIQSILDNVQATSYKIFLTGKKQFREQVATIKPYKGNRDPLHKPVHYQAIKDYLIDKWSAVVVDHYEADDAMAMEQSKYWDTEIAGINYSTQDTIICSIDKDLDQVPGWHYQFNKKEKYWVSEDEALKFFYQQLISGDPTDNIQGIPGIGPAKAKKAISKCKTELQMWETVKQLYLGYYKNETIAMDIIMETAKLIYMIKEEGVEWSPLC